MKRSVIAAALCAVLASCQTTPPQRNAAPATVPKNYRAVTAYFIKSTLKDPYSVRDARISAPVTLSGLMIGGNKPGVCVVFNARNSFGGYVGMQSFSVAFDGGVPVGPFDGTCPNETWTPFTELMQ